MYSQAATEPLTTRKADSCGMTGVFGMLAPLILGDSRLALLLECHFVAARSHTVKVKHHRVNFKANLPKREDEMRSTWCGE
jgi:hypothetical protein